jgi:hypothetical protein
MNQQILVKYFVLLQSTALLYYDRLAWNQALGYFYILGPGKLVSEASQWFTNIARYLQLIGLNRRQNCESFRSEEKVTYLNN